MAPFTPLLLRSPHIHSPPPPVSPITPSSLAGIWRVTLGQFNLTSLSTSQSLRSVVLPLQQVLFSTPPYSISCFLTHHSCFQFTCPFLKVQYVTFIAIYRHEMGEKIDSCSLCKVTKNKLLLRFHLLNISNDMGVPARRGPHCITMHLQ